MSPAELKVALDTVWVLVAGFLVFWMNAGFGLVEAGLCRKKNAVMILSKNFVVFGISTIGFWALGFGLMFADGGIVGTSGYFLSGADNSPAMGEAYKGVFGSLNWTGVPLAAKFFFQLVFCGTAATIVSGAVNERTKYGAFLVFSIVLTAIIYPVAGHWIWGGGFLAKSGFFDFAGSTVVHSIGGWAALAGIIVVGPRLGRYDAKTGKPTPVPGHNMALVFLGGLILWLGWFGFNPGSTMGVDANMISHVALTTNLAACVGTVVATLYAWLRTGKPDFSLTVNGCLAGLVAITAPCAFVSPSSAVIIGAVGGFLVIEAVLFFDRLKIDDPVGATSVHLVNGLWGTMAVGLFGIKGMSGLGNDGLFLGGGVTQLLIQLKGMAAVAAFVFPASLALWYAIKTLMGVRVRAEDEIAGLDVAEMGMEAYPEAQEIEAKVREVAPVPAARVGVPVAIEAK
jgi:Amt family ammonium transporter